jgi:hypothetical protein
MTHGCHGWRVASLALIVADIRIARLSGDLLSVPVKGELDGRDFILGLDGVVGHLVNGDNEPGHGGDSFAHKVRRRSMMPRACVLVRSSRVRFSPVFRRSAADGGAMGGCQWVPRLHQRGCADTPEV